MKNICLIIMLLVVCLLSAAPFKSFPYQVTQPDGTVLNLFAAGDEYFNYLHDAQKYTVIKDPQSGWYCYAESVDGLVRASSAVYGLANPATKGIQPGIIISKEEYKKRRDTKFPGGERSLRCPGTGTVNNVVVYIRFSDQTEFPEPRSQYDLKFNGDSNSLQDYFDEISYNQLNIVSNHYPSCAMTTNLSYQDSHPRNYYVAYNATTNPIGYTSDNQTQREHQLLANAIASIEDDVPTDLIIDADNDNKVDNVCFIIRGGNEGWAELLWAHRWFLFSQNAYIHGKQVYDYTFQPASQNDVNTICHEMFHSIGAPDLYHYTDSPFSPCGPWDIMDGGSGHPTAFMKWKYGGWISDIPIINTTQQITLNSLLDPVNNAVRIPSPNSTTEYFIVEYRKRTTGTYENNIPGSGLIIYRINTVVGDGNADGPPDELYIYRPNGDNENQGDLNSAYFSEQSGRTEFSDYTNPSCFLNNNYPGEIVIASVGIAGETITFYNSPENGYLMGHVTSPVTGFDFSTASLTLGNNEVEIDPTGSFNFEAYQGTYPLLLTAPGHRRITDNVTILPNDVFNITYDLQSLISPSDLYYISTGNIATFCWNFNNFSDTTFVNFKVLASINNGNFNTIRTTTDTTTTITFNQLTNVRIMVRADYLDGQSLSTDPIFVDLTGNEDVVTVDNSLSIYPNPFNPRTKIVWNQKEAGMVNLSLYDIKGRLVSQLIKEVKTSGQHAFDLNTDKVASKRLASGMYLVRLETPTGKSIKKIVLLK